MRPTVSYLLPNYEKIWTKLTQKQFNFTFYKNVTSKKVAWFFEDLLTYRTVGE